jgi:hypothetical protein
MRKARMHVSQPFTLGTTTIGTIWLGTYATSTRWFTRAASRALEAGLGSQQCSRLPRHNLKGNLGLKKPGHFWPMAAFGALIALRGGMNGVP